MTYMIAIRNAKGEAVWFEDSILPLWPPQALEHCEIDFADKRLHLCEPCGGRICHVLVPVDATPGAAYRKLCPMLFHDLISRYRDPGWTPEIVV